MEFNLYDLSNPENEKPAKIETIYDILLNSIIIEIITINNVSMDQALYIFQEKWRYRIGAD